MKHTCNWLGRKMTLLVLRLLLYLQLVFYHSASSKYGEKCVLLTSPDDKQCDKISEGLIKIKSTTIQLHSIPSSEVFAAAISFVYKEGKYMTCSEIIGVIGELDSKTARILHTLFNRSNLSATLVASSTPLYSLPVTELALPDVLDMNPIQHYIDATVSFRGSTQLDSYWLDN